MGTFSDSGGYTGNVFRFNLSINDALTKGGSIYLSGSTDGEGGYAFYNNTIISLAGQPCVFSQLGYSFFNKSFYNNIFYTATGPCVAFPTAATGAAYDYNWYYDAATGGFNATYGGTAYATLAAWRAATSGDAHSIAGTSSPFVGPLTPVPAFVPGSFSLDTPYWLTSGSTPRAPAPTSRRCARSMPGRRT